MTDEDERADRHTGSEPDQSTVREWARKTYLREHMRDDALPDHQLKLLDERISRWTMDRQIDGHLPSESELRLRLNTLAKEIRNTHEQARPIFTADEIVDVDASRGAAAMRDYIENQRDFAPGLSQVSVRYAVSANLSELDARKRIAERFDRLFGSPITEYAKAHSQDQAGNPDRTFSDKLFPPELGWDRYEPAFRRLAMHDSKLHVDRRDGAISEKQFQETRKQRDAWENEQRERGKLPSLREMGAAPISVQETLLPFKKQFGRQERRRMHGEDSAYWRRADEVAGYLKDDIEAERRYTRSIEDYAISYADGYGRPVERMKRDIEIRFTLHNLYSPSEYLERQFDLKAEVHPSLDAKEERDVLGPSGPETGHERGGGRKR